MHVLLHIGIDKTGSTSIQRHLTVNRAWFGQHGTYIPRCGLGVSNGHAELFTGMSAKELRALVTELSAARERNFELAILSWEGLSFFGEQEIRQLATALKAFNVRVLVYLREQAEIIQTGVLQQIKTLQSAPPLAELECSDNFHQHLCNGQRNYHRLLLHWQRGFPAADFNVRIFDRAVLTAGDVISDFLQQVGCPENDAFQRVEDLSNKSLYVESGLLVQRWMAQGLSRDELRNRVDALLEMMECGERGSRYFLNKETVARIRAYYSDSNRALASEFIPGVTEPFPNPKASWREQELDALAKRVEHLEAACAPLLDIPFAKSPVRGENLRDGVQLVSGWAQPEDWGVATSDSEATLRFRTAPRRRTPPGVKTARLVLKGIYSQDGGKTRIFLNDVDLGEHCLQPPVAPLEVPLEVVRRKPYVELRLVHEDNRDEQQQLLLAMVALHTDQPQYEPLPGE